jgi:gliding motility-associated-like protein
MTNRNFLCILSCFLIAFFAFQQPLMATHQRAAEITYRHLDGLTYEFTLISYTFTPSPANAYRDYLRVEWGDNTADDIPRVEVKYLPNDITFNRYVGRHTFAAPSTYTISCEDPNRNGGILNIPNSVNTPLFIYSELTINPFLEGYNNSPVLLLPPIDNGCVNQPYYHNPGAYDEDGDSLSYRLVPCRGALGQVIQGYTYPPASNIFHLDSVTGDLVWDSPPKQGEYNIAILIEEWRKGIRIGSVLRDMQIIIIACDNQPPVIELPADTCVEAGKTLRFLVSASDPDSNEVTLTATGGPFVMTNSPATMDPNPAVGTGHTESLFRWFTNCNHIARRPYQAFFKAKDNASPVSLVNIKSLKITVVGPAPTSLTATPFGNTITLTWDPYSCPNASGYYIYRKADSTGFVPDYCQTGVPPYLGYSMIGKISDLSVNSFLDDNKGAGLVRGVRYCYLLVAWYPDKAESYASNETCATLKKDVPIITNVSILSTSENTGRVYTAWSKPTEIDTLQAPGPYKYLVNRRIAGGSYAVIDSMASLNDTIFNDSLLNTRDLGFYYRIDLYNDTPGNRFLIGSAQPAGSMYLKITPTDRALKLSWNNEVPWSNDTFVVYRLNPSTSLFDSVGYSLAPAYNDKGLVNGMTYCYRIRSIGRYSSPGFIDPIINESQENCGIPVDNVPPCPPVLTVTPNCDNWTNTLAWTILYDSCRQNIALYYIYYSPIAGSDLLLTDSLMNPKDTTYIHQPARSIVGCYAVEAVDSAGNRSGFSNIVCMDADGCPAYRLPNVFTPNGDTFNDRFIPWPYTSVSDIILDIYDRWGRLVYTTTDPDVNWDGNDMTTNQPCSDGTYFYVCEVHQITLSGTITLMLKGSVTIVR